MVLSTWFDWLLPSSSNRSMAITFSSLSMFHRPLSPHHTFLQPLFPLALIQSWCHTLFIMASAFLSCRPHSVSSSVPLPYGSSANLRHSPKVNVPPAPHLHLIYMGECRIKWTQWWSNPAASGVTPHFSGLPDTQGTPQQKPSSSRTAKCKSWAALHTLRITFKKPAGRHSSWRCWLTRPSYWSIIFRVFGAYLTALSCRKMHPGKVRNDAKFCWFSKQKCLETL